MSYVLKYNNKSYTLNTNGKSYLLKVAPKSYKFTINATPENAIVTINGETTNSIKLAESSTVDWSVSLDGYKTQTGSLSLNEDTTVEVILEEEEQPRGELAYAHYVSSDMGEHFYAKAPLGEDLTKYGVDFYGSREATNISEIQPVISPGNGATQYWDSVTEDIAEVSLFIFNRDKNGDMYKETPQYACYYDEYHYYYAKTPIGSDMKIYVNQDSRESPAFGIGSLVSSGSWESLTEEFGVDKHGDEYPRYYEGDLYE